MSNHKYSIKENYITRDADPEKWKNHPNEQIIQHYSDIIHGYVLDFGCNHGACSFLLCENNRVNKILGLDINPSAIEIANNTKLLHRKCDIDFISANILDFNFNGTFDTIISFHTIEHIYPEDIDIVIHKLYESLNIKGHCIISIPYEKAFYDPIQHVAFYNEDSLSLLFNRNGFRTVECLNDTRFSESNILTGIFQKI